MKISTKTMVVIGMFTAILSVLSILTIPMPSGVPFTLQTFAMALCGYVLGPKRGIASTLLYVLLGTIGIPVFAGMVGGPSWIVGYSGGFIWGFLFLTIFCGIGILQKNIIVRWGFGIAGIFICHLLGVIQFAIVASVPIMASFLTVSIPYIIKDICSVVGAYLVAIPVRKALLVSDIQTGEMRDEVWEEK